MPKQSVNKCIFPKQNDTVKQSELRQLAGRSSSVLVQSEMAEKI